MRFLGGIWKRKINGETLDYYPCPYMVGDIFITTNSIKPEIRYPGTEWEELPEETYLMTASSAHPVKSTCGENEVTLTVEQIPAHSHSVTKGSNVNANGWNFMSGYGGDVPSGTKNNTDQTGGGQAHNNMPKSYAIYGYIRIA